MIDTAANGTIGEPVPAGQDLRSVAVSPDGTRAYVTDEALGTVAVIDTHTNSLLGGPIPVGEGPFGVAIPPAQAPAASFKALRARPAVPVSFDASASKDADGTISAYAWDFGDHRSALRRSGVATHTYAKPGTYKVALKVTDNEGCSTLLIFTGQTASCNGQARAATTRLVKVAFPGVRVRCPKSAAPKGCTFKLQAVAKVPKPGRRAKVESAVAKARVKPGRAAIVSLKPKRAFAKRLAGAKRVTVAETLLAGGARRSSYAQLKIVQ